MPGLSAEYAGEYHWPVEAGVISSEYGKRFGRLHKGIDVAVNPREFLVGGPFEAPRLQGQMDPLREFLVASREE